jgi:bifunctional non-homologous end joining protein LigD
VAEVELTHPEKVLFPADGLTKADLAAYFEAVAPAMLAHLEDRPLSMQRFDRGVGQRGIFIQNVPKGAPPWLRRVETPNRGGGTTAHVVVDNADGLRWLAQQNMPTVHGWTARADRLDRPDRLVWDLDPVGPEAFGVARATALALGDVLREAGREPFAMTSGSKGLHVVLPIARRWAWDEARAAMVAVAEEVVARDPSTRTLEWLKADRGGRLLVDVRTGYGHTTVAPYAVRARDGAPVATPLHWEEVEDPDLHAQAFRLRDVPARLAALGGDPWAGIAAAAGALPRV